MDTPKNIWIKVEDTEDFHNDENGTSVLNEESIGEYAYGIENNRLTDSIKALSHKKRLATKDADSQNKDKRLNGIGKEQSLVAPPYTLRNGIYRCSKCLFKTKSKERTKNHFDMLHKNWTTFFNNITNNIYQIPNYKNTDNLFTLAEEVKPILFDCFIGTDATDVAEITDLVSTIKSEDSKKEDNMQTDTTKNNGTVDQNNATNSNLLLSNFAPKQNLGLEVVTTNYALSYRAESLTYECGCCSFLTTSVAKAAEHIKQIHNHNDLHCFCCNYSTNATKQFNRHIEYHLSDTDLKMMILLTKADTNIHKSTCNESFECFNCNFIANSMKDLIKHYFLMHIKKLVYCITCKQEFQFLTLLETHIKDVHILNRAYNCLYCAFSTKKQKDFGKHMKCHKSDIFEEPNEGLQNYTKIVSNKDSVNILESPRFYKCFQCTFYTKHKGNMVTHFKLHKYESPEIKSDILKSHKGSTAETSTDNSYKCSYCSFVSVLKKSLKEHVIKIHGDKQPYYYCKLCRKHFVSLLGRKNHMRKMHVERKKLFCMHCKFSSVYLRNLEMHMQFHTGELSQLCYVCGFRSVYKVQMDVHIRKHLGLKQYSCNVCAYKSSDKSKLCEHMYSHSNERPFACDECSHRSKNKRDLKLHKETHIVNKPIACELCDYTCMRNEYLNRHMKIHQVNRERKFFECDRCSKQFASKSSLKQHVLLHYGIKQNCRFCSFTTNRTAGLQIHESRHSELSRMHCFECSYNSTHRANFIEHVNKTCTRARRREESLKYCYYCGYSTSHRSNFVHHVMKGCSKLKKIKKKRTKVR